MITKEEALTAREFHENGCQVIIGPRGGKKIVCTVWRRNGSTSTWKRNPGAFRVPVKHGLYQYSAIGEHNADKFHVSDSTDCPLNQ